jgi:hypothetical protein
MSKECVVGPTSVRSAYHKACGRKVRWENITDDKGKTVGRKKHTEVREGSPSMRTWAKGQIDTSGPHADLCRAWFAQKSSARDDAPRAARLASKGSRYRAEASASKTARKSKKSVKKTVVDAAPVARGRISD